MTVYPFIELQSSFCLVCYNVLYKRGHTVVVVVVVVFVGFIVAVSKTNTSEGPDQSSLVLALTVTLFIV